MEKYPITLFCPSEVPCATNKFEETMNTNNLLYSFRNLSSLDEIPQECILDALQKSIQICFLAGIEVSHHFKQIYVYDSTIDTLQVDWLISKNGFNLMLMHIPSLNKKRATWLWELANF